MKNFEKLNNEYLRLRKKMENDSLDDEQDVYDLEQRVQKELEAGFENNQPQLRGLLNQIKKMIKEFDLPDQESELDMMFPDRHDEDFDPDSMSPDSVFGKD